MTASRVSEGQSSVDSAPPIKLTSCNISAEPSQQSNKQFHPSTTEDVDETPLASAAQQQLISHVNVFSRLRSVMATSLRWCPTSLEELAESEQKLLSG